MIAGRSRCLRFWRDRRGVAATEFALIVPLLSAMLLGVVQYGGMIIAYDQMHAGVASGALYVMRGGTDATVAHDLSLGAWPNKPADAAISIAQRCTCAGVTAPCNAVCTDGSYPQAYWTLTGQGTYSGVFGSKSMNTTQIVRSQ